MLILTAVLTMFVAIALLALTVDLGNVTYHRAQLQNGADSASLALAAACAQQKDCGVTTSLSGLAADNANVSDQSMTIDSGPKTCLGGAPYTGATTLQPCPNSPATEDTSSISNCQPWPLAASATAVSYVEVTTRTEMEGGSPVLPYYFGQLLGAGKGTTQETCARAAWGPAGSTGATLPITMGMCDWQKATSNGTKYATAPPYSVAPKSGSAPPPEVTSPVNLVTGIFLHDSGNNMCDTQPNGGFSWLDPGSDCTVTIDGGDMAQGKPGASASCQEIPAAYLGKVVTVPIFDYFTGTGSSAQYHVKGIAAFYLAGYDNVPSAKPNKTGSVYNEPAGVCTGKCTGSTTYVWGWFVSSLLPVDSAVIDPGGSDLGARVVVPAG